MTYDELMQSFAAKCGLSELTIQDDIAALEIDDMPFGFIHKPLEDVLVVIADLGRQTISADGAFGAMMLKANFLFEATKGATIFQNPENESFGLQQMYHLVDLDVDRLSAEVEKLANLAEYWRGVLAGCVHAEAVAKAQKSESDATSRLAFGDSGLMRI